MAQTHYLRSVIRLTWREAWTAITRRRLAVSATVRPEGLHDIKIGPFSGNENESDAWIKTGSRTGVPDQTRPVLRRDLP